MPRLSYESDSELEREFELELQDRSEQDEGEIEEQFEVLGPATARESNEPEERFAERFFELSQREFESEADVDDAVNRLLGEMEREFFFKGLMKKVKGAGKKLLSKGISHLGKQLGSKFPAIQAITQLARGNLKGALGGLAKTALTAGLAAVPGGAVALPALKALGFESGMDDPDAQREAWGRYVTLVREAYDDLATNLSSEADDPVEASRLASASFRAALSRTQGRGGAGGTPGGVRRIRLRAGERLLIEVG